MDGETSRIESEPQLEEPNNRYNGQACVMTKGRTSSAAPSVINVNVSNKKNSK